jgi:hypothetical protein
MRQLFAAQLAPTLRELAVDAPAVRAGLVATQTLGLALCRYILAVGPVTELSPDDIVSWLGPTLTRYLTAPLP